ncbi:MAG TPA: glutathione ABC transporter permease GsiC [Firmicutes bacterium]|nr:glutathione ABC transporter permease GsiC [Bacillota bacterium]
MGSYLLRRILTAFGSLVGVTFVTFLLIFLVPGDPAEMVAEARFGHAVGDREVELVRVMVGFDQSIPTQYWRWMGHLLSLDLGHSLINRRPVLELIRSRLPATLLLAFSSLLVSLAIALPAGLMAALRKDTWLDTGARLFALVGVSIPGFWLSYLLIMLFSLELKLLPVSGYGGLETLVMPSLALGLGMTGLVARLLRASLLEVWQQDYLRAARANGIGEKKILFKYALKNAMIPVVTVIGLQLGMLLSGTVIIESIFGWPGLGKLLLDGIFNRDFPVVQGCVLVIACCFIMINVLVDLFYAWLDPRIRWSTGG